MPPAGRRALPLPPEERRAAIVAAVIPMLEASGGMLSTKQIAEAACIAEGTIFRAFPDKRALLHAVAQEVVAPEGWREEMAESLGRLPGLRAKVQAATERMVARTSRLLLVMTAIKRNFMAEGPPPPGPHGPPAVPEFLRTSGQQLHEALTDLVFEPHRDELSVTPEQAARGLRALVMGTWHPGGHDDDRMTPEEITDLLLHGIAAGGR